MSVGPSSGSSPSPSIFHSSDDSPRSRLPPSVTPQLLLGVGLYYGVLAFNLSVTFWIGESLMGMSGLLMHLPVIALLMFRLAGPRDVSPSG